MAIGGKLWINTQERVSAAGLSRLCVLDFGWLVSECRPA